MYRLFDTHAHLEEMEDLGKVLADAKQAGVIGIVAVGSDLASNEKVLDLAALYPDFVYPALGWHPWYIKEAEMAANLEYLASNIGKAVAVGEVGLDYHKKVRAAADKDLQKRVLKEILNMAKVHNKPALIHSRYAWRDALEAVREAGVEKAVFHWYTGTSGVLRDIIAGGYYISVTPAVEYHEEHRRAVREAPLERLLLETDSPVVYRRGSELEYRSNPACIVRSLIGAAILKGVSDVKMAETTTANARELFGMG